MIAIENRHDKAVKLLLDKCRGFINVDLQDKTQRTALQLAVEMGNNNWVQLLLDSHAKQHHKDSLGRMAAASRRGAGAHRGGKRPAQGDKHTGQ